MVLGVVRKNASISRRWHHASDDDQDTPLRRGSSFFSAPYFRADRQSFCYEARFVNLERQFSRASVKEDVARGTAGEVANTRNRSVAGVCAEIDTSDRLAACDLPLVDVARILRKRC